MGSKKKSAKSKLEERFAQAWAEQCPDLPQPAREYRFAARHVGQGPGVRQRLKDAGLRDWRFDFAWVVYGPPERVPYIRFDGAVPNVSASRRRLIRVALEIEGGTWGKVIRCPHCYRSTGKRGAGGRHTRGGGFAGDVDKYNSANDLGWTVYRATSEHLKPGRIEELVAMLRRAIGE